MASPKLEAFALYNLTTGAVLTGQAGSMSFTTYKDDLGNNLSHPTISEIGGGWYSFLPTFADPARGIVYVIDCGSNANPAKVSRFMRPEDWNADRVPEIATVVHDLQDYSEGKWEIVTVGPNANQMLFYAADGTTVLKRYSLLDKNGVPTSVNPFKRVPI